MRRLIIWITILIVLSSLSLLSLRTSNAAACVQLLAPETGSVLTVDINTGRAHLDARTTYPVPTVDPLDMWRYSSTYPVSPDQRYVLDTYSYSESGSVYDLMLGPRSDTHRRRINVSTDHPAEHFEWAPTSTHFAFTELRGFGANSALVSLVIADINGTILHREEIPEAVDDGWLQSNHTFFWSPDGMSLAVPLSASNVGGTLLLYSIADASYLYLPVPDTVIDYVGWSPNGDYAFVLTNLSNEEQPHAYLINRDGSLFKPLVLSDDYRPYIDQESSNLEGRRWSPDGQFFFVTNRRDVHIFDLNGTNLLAAPLSVERVFWAPLPHTLVYVTNQDDPQKLMALDVAAQHTTLVASLAMDVYDASRLIPDLPEMTVIAQGKSGTVVPHLISLDLSNDETPFGEIPFIPVKRSHKGVYVVRSPDQQQIAVVVETASQFIVMWRSRASDQVRQFHIAKQGSLDELLSARWLTNDTMLITTQRGLGYRNGFMLLNTQTSHLMPLVPYADSVGYQYYANDDTHLILRTDKGFNSYKMSDGQPVLSVTQPSEGFIPFFDSRFDAILLYRDRNSGDSVKYLFLGTAHSVDSITGQVLMTQPAWSPDDTMFAYGAITDYDEGWRVKLMSRDGVLLKDYLVDIPYGFSYYERLRWTNCG